MLDENKTFLPCLIESAKPELKYWLESSLYLPDAQERIRNWDMNKSPDILDIITDKSDIEGMEAFYLPVLRDILWNHHLALRRLESGYTSPSTASVSSDAGVGAASKYSS